jgi:hypothetical protein
MAKKRVADTYNKGQGTSVHARLLHLAGLRGQFRGGGCRGARPLPCAASSPLGSPTRMTKVQWTHRARTYELKKDDQSKDNMLRIRLELSHLIFFCKAVNQTNDYIFQENNKAKTCLQERPNTTKYRNTHQSTWLHTLFSYIDLSYCLKSTYCTCDSTLSVFSARPAKALSKRFNSGRRTLVRFWACSGNAALRRALES